MRARIRSVVATFGWRQWLLAGIFVLALVFATLFTVRTVTFALYWRNHHQEPIERWMTVNYVAHSYVVPREVLEEALGIPPSRPPIRPDRRPLGQIAQEQGKSFDQVKATLLDAIAKARPPVPPSGLPGAPPAPEQAPPPSKGVAGDRGAS